LFICRYCFIVYIQSTFFFSYHSPHLKCFVKNGLQMERRFGHYIALYNYWLHTRYTEKTVAKIKRIKGHRMIYRCTLWNVKYEHQI
jgi:hypothetical protein